jgi:hypothetical protein
MSLSGIAASSDLRAPLAEPCGFLLAAMRRSSFPATVITWRFLAKSELSADAIRGSRRTLARVEVGDYGEHAAVIVLRLG